MFIREKFLKKSKDAVREGLLGSAAIFVAIIGVGVFGGGTGPQIDTNVSKTQSFTTTTKYILKNSTQTNSTNPSDYDLNKDMNIDTLNTAFNHFVNEFNAIKYDGSRSDMDIIANIKKVSYKAKNLKNLDKVDSMIAEELVKNLDEFIADYDLKSKNVELKETLGKKVQTISYYDFNNNTTTTKVKNNVSKPS